MPSPSNVMEHKEMLIWHKETLKSEKEYKSRPNDRFGLKRLKGYETTRAIEATRFAKVGEEGLSDYVIQAVTVTRCTAT